MNIKSIRKSSLQDLAIFGGECFFEEPKSTSNLVQPDFNNFLHYSKQFYERQHYTNNGILVKQLEKRLAEFHEVNHSVALCSGFWALVLAISSLSLEGKSEIIMPSLTYRRMADVAAWAKLKPHFCDVDKKTLSMSRQTVEACINDETALILAVHPIVNTCDIDGIIGLGLEFGIPVLFDSVESVYESSSSGKIGGFGDAECFSMHASKLLNGFEGGYVTTNNTELANELSLLRSFGFAGQDNCVLAGGLNAKLNEMHAAMALANLDVLDKQIVDNRKRYIKYKHGLIGVPGVRLLEFDESYDTSYKNIVVEFLDSWPLSRDDTVAILNAENILARSYYSPPLHKKKMEYPSVPAFLENTDYLADRFMLLPCGDLVTCDDIEDIVNFLRFVCFHGAEISYSLPQKNVRK